MMIMSCEWMSGNTSTRPRPRLFVELMDDESKWDLIVYLIMII